MGKECTYQGDDRRVVVERRALHQLYPCPLHDIFTKGLEKDLKAGEDKMKSFEEKIDRILVVLAQQNTEMQLLKMTIGNGLGKEVRDTKECIESLADKFTQVCKNYDKKFMEVDEFRWFRTWANWMKDKAVVWGLTSAFVGGAVVSVIALAIYAILKLLEKI